MFTQKCMDSFLDGKVRNQLVWFKCLTGHRIKLPHPMKMIKNHRPLIRDSTWGYHRVSENIKSNFAAEMIRNFCWNIRLPGFPKNFLKLI